MGRNVSSVVKLQGNVDGLSYYERDGKQFVRRTPKSNKAKFDTAESMARVRENASEFKAVTHSAKKLWDTLRPLTANNKDGKSFLRLRSIMNELKKQDATSQRGKRDPLLALAVASGKQLLKGFDFNSKAQLDSIMFKPFTVDTTAGTLLIEGLNPLVHLSIEPSATHFSMKLCKADIDISTGKSELVISNEAQFAVTAPAANITLQLEDDTTINGLQLFVLQICFFQEMNGQMYPLKDKAHNASKIIEVL
jgi:hypothetical protein